MLEGFILLFKESAKGADIFWIDFALYIIEVTLACYKFKQSPQLTPGQVEYLFGFDPIGFWEEIF